MLIPVGEKGKMQTLKMVDRDQDGKVRLVPLLEIGDLLPNNQCQHRTLHIQKDAAFTRTAASYVWDSRSFPQPRCGIHSR